MNKIIAIGYVGTQRCYLNVDKEEAINRYCKSENITREEFDENTTISIDVVKFEDEFETYAIWE